MTIKQQGISYNRDTLPQSDNINRYSFSVEVTTEWFLKRGKMIAYYGHLSFQSIGSDVLDILVKEAFNAPQSINDYIVVEGQGKLILADNRRDLAGFDLDDANMTIQAKHLIAFSPTLTCQESLLSGYLTLIGTGHLIASSNGPVHFLASPVRVDQDALVAWADIPTPSYYYDYHHAESLLGGLGALSGMTLSGEEKQINFVGEGTVLLQSLEVQQDLELGQDTEE
jgi:uncharacterized protein (AIM24 family)